MLITRQVINSSQKKWEKIFLFRSLLLTSQPQTNHQPKKKQMKGMRQLSDTHKQYADIQVGAELTDEVHNYGSYQTLAFAFERVL